MKLGKKRVSNLFWPSFSKTFVMSEFTSQRINDNLNDSEDDVKMQDGNIPVGIIDSIKMNKEYKELLKNLEIDQLENIQALQIIEDAFNDNDNLKITKSLRIDDDVQYEDKNKQQIDQSQLQQDIDIVFLWRSSKSSLASISKKIGVN